VISSKGGKFALFPDFSPFIPRELTSLQKTGPFIWLPTSVPWSEMFSEFRIPNTSAWYAKEITNSACMKT
jgi:hypothetical protein